ncbi:MAG: hypothetical protein ACOCUV_00005 [bacterium]
MKTKEIYKKIIDSIETTISAVNGEVEIVKKSIDSINALTWNPNIKVRTGFCHQKPYAFFVTPDRVFDKVKTELGDYLFVIKYKDNDSIIDRRALFFQAKYNKTGNPFSIELHQFHFYRQIDKIDFRFGNSVYKSGGYNPILWLNISYPSNFGDYILLGDNFAIDILTKEIANQYEHKKNGHFTFNLGSICDLWHFRKHHDFCCCGDYSPLFDFLTPFGKGNKIEGQFEHFIDLIYKRLGMIPDPPEEHEGFWEESDGSGFGVIEITINNTENIKD